MTARIRVRGVDLQVPHFVHRDRSAKSWLATLLTAATSRLQREYRTLLQGIDIEANEGDRIALLGRNGAGKTTLLRVLSGALEPTRGDVEIVGTRQALLNLGLGFNPEATVKENIYLRGTAMGLKPAVIRHLVAPVLDFADLADVAQHRLATLSSGQRMRLGFAVSTSVQHDIMLLDEWFGAGDAEFVDKARARMSDRVAGSKIVVLASHNFQMLRQVCNLGLVLDHGRVQYFGTVDGAIDAYKDIYQSTEEYQSERARLEREAAALLKKSGREDRESRQKLREEWAKLRAEKARWREQRDQRRRAREERAAAGERPVTDRTDPE